MKHSFFVIEDHALTNLGIREILQSSTDFFCAGFATNESEAFLKLTELDMTSSLPEILILDLFLGEDSGIDILHEVTKHFPKINVIVYSMYSNPAIVSLVLESGAKGFVSKASPESELINAIHAISNGETYVQQSLLKQLHTYNSIFESLTKTEQNVFRGIIERKNFEKISDEMSISTHSVENYFARILSKTGCRSKDDLIARFG